MGWVRTIEKHVLVMIGFHNEAVAPLEPYLHQVGNNSQICTDPQSGPLMLHDESHRFTGIVGNREWVDPQVSDAKR
jgi:hypothetical protein